MSQWFQFELAFAIPEQSFDQEVLSEAVYNAGFQDAVVGTGNKGLLGIELDDL